MKIKLIGMMFSLSVLSLGQASKDYRLVKSDTIKERQAPSFPPVRWLKQSKDNEGYNVLFLLNPNKRVSIRAVTLKKLNENIAALVTFRRKRQPRFDLDGKILASIKAVQLKTGLFEADVDDLIEPDVHQTLWKSNGDTTDTNCFGATLYGAGIIPEFQYSESWPYYHYTHSQQCRKLDPMERPQTGDLVSMHRFVDGRWHESHSAVYLSDDILFSKNGGGPMEFQPSSFVASLYLTGEKSVCAQNRQLTSAEEQQCVGRLDYFRCQTTEAFLKEGDFLDKTSEELSQAFQAVFRTFEILNLAYYYAEDLYENETYRLEKSLDLYQYLDMTDENREEAGRYRSQFPREPQVYSFRFPRLPFDITREIKCLQNPPPDNAPFYARCLADLDNQSKFYGLFKEYMVKHVKALVTKIKTTQAQLDSLLPGSPEAITLSKRLYFLRSLYYRAVNKDIVIAWKGLDNKELTLTGYHSQAVAEYLAPKK